MVTSTDSARHARQEREREKERKRERERERERGRYEIRYEIREREGAKRHVDHSLNCIPFVKID